MATFAGSVGGFSSASGSRGSSRDGSVGTLASTDASRPSVRGSSTGILDPTDAGRSGDLRDVSLGVGYGLEGVPIPNVFRPVACRIENTKGEPIENALWVMSGGQFPTAAPVDDEGMARLYLLSIQYDTFQILATSGQPGVDYVWYQTEDASVSPLDDTATLTFNEERPGGTYAAAGVRLGL